MEMEMKMQMAYKEGTTKFGLRDPLNFPSHPPSISSHQDKASRSQAARHHISLDFSIT
jgi:hypothetical protein